MKHLILPILSLFILSGCGGGSANSGNGGGSSVKNEVPMILDQPYTVNSGDRIVKTSDDAVVTVKHIDGHTESTVILTAGEANIIRKQ